MRTWRKLLQRSWPDYLCIVVIIVLTLVIRRALTPARRLLHEDLLQELGYPARVRAIPDWFLGVCWLIPACVFIAAGVFGSLSAFKTHEHCVSFFLSHLLSAFLTIAARRLVRVLLEARALHHNNDAGDTRASCVAGSKDSVDTGYTSFPSSTAGITVADGLYTTLFLVHFWKVYSGSGRPFQACVALVPVILGLWMSLVPYTDYAQHATDVIAGAAIGASLAVFFFYQAHFTREEPIVSIDAAEGVAAATGEPSTGDPTAEASVAGPSNGRAVHATAPQQEVQMKDMYAAAEIARAGKQNPFA